MNHSNSLSVCNENSCNENTCNDNQELIILSKQTLTQTQKEVFRDYPLYLNKKTQHTPTAQQPKVVYA